MSQKPERNEEDENDILNKLPPELFERTYHEVLSKVQAESCSKNLKNFGKNIILNASQFPAHDLAETERMAELCYSQLAVFAGEVEDAMHSIVKEKFQDPSFLNEVKEEVLKCMKVEEEGEDFDKAKKTKEEVLKCVKAEEGEDFDKAKKNPHGTSQKSLPIDMRKLNTEYASEDIISPSSVKQMEIEKMSMNRNSTKIHSVTRKVARKNRKNLLISEIVKQLTPIEYSGTIYKKS